MWSAIFLAGPTVNNIAIVINAVMLPDLDLRLARLIPSAIGTACLAYGFLWDRRIDAGSSRSIINDVAENLPGAILLEHRSTHAHVELHAADVAHMKRRVAMYPIGSDSRCRPQIARRSTRSAFPPRVTARS